MDLSFDSMLMMWSTMCFFLSFIFFNRGYLRSELLISTLSIWLSLSLRFSFASLRPLDDLPVNRSLELWTAAKGAGVRSRISSMLSSFGFVILNRF